MTSLPPEPQMTSAFEVPRWTLFPAGPLIVHLSVPGPFRLAVPGPGPPLSSFVVDGGVMLMSQVLSITVLVVSVSLTTCEVKWPRRGWGALTRKVSAAPFASEVWSIESQMYWLLVA